MVCLSEFSNFVLCFTSKIVFSQTGYWIIKVIAGNKREPREKEKSYLKEGKITCLRQSDWLIALLIEEKKKYFFKKIREPYTQLWSHQKLSQIILPTNMGASYEHV